MTESHIDKLLAILDRQSDSKLNPNLMAGYLGLINLMSIMSLIHTSGEQGSFQLPAGLEVNLPQALSDEKSLKNTMASLLSSAGGNMMGGNSGTPDLAGLLNMVGGNKKVNPQMLLTLMNLMNSMKPKGEDNETDNVSKSEAEEEKVSNKSRPVEVKADKKRLL